MVFEICMIVMATSTVLAALSTVVKNLVHAAGVREAKKVAEKAGAGAVFGAALGGALEGFISSNSALKVQLAEKEHKRMVEILESHVKVIERLDRELKKAQRPPARVWLWLKAQFSKKPAPVASAD